MRGWMKAIVNVIGAMYDKGEVISKEHKLAKDLFDKGSYQQLIVYAIALTSPQHDTEIETPILKTYRRLVRQKQEKGYNAEAILSMMSSELRLGGEEPCRD